MRPVHRVSFFHETLICGSPSDRQCPIPIGDPGYPSGRVAHCAERGRCLHDPKACNSARQCRDRTDNASKRIMVYKCTFCAILGVGDQDVPVAIPVWDHYSSRVNLRQWVTYPVQYHTNEDEPPEPVRFNATQLGTSLRHWITYPVPRRTCN